MNSIRTWWMAVLLALLVCGGCDGGGDVTSCTMDTQCKGDRLCVSGICQAVGDSAYTCEEVCDKLSHCDWTDPNIADYYSYCLINNCYGDEWTEEAKNCSMKAPCAEIDEQCEHLIP
jgi:hypothetical protein